MRRSVSLTMIAVISAMYFVLCLIFQSLSFGIIQIRPSEALSIMPIFGVFGIAGMSIGCLLSNTFLSPFGIWDVLIGTFATLIASILTYLTRRKILLALSFPCVINALLLPLVWLLLGVETVYWINVLSVLLSQFVAVYALGLPLYHLLNKNGINKLLNTNK